MTNRADEIRSKFLEFDRANPDVWREFERIALGIASRRPRYGAKKIIEEVRWHLAHATTGQPYKINNIFTSHYARKFIEWHPHHTAFFETRMLISRRSAPRGVPQGYLFKT